MKFVEKCVKLTTEKSVDFLVKVGGYDRRVIEEDDKLKVVKLDKIVYDKINQISEFYYIVIYCDWNNDNFGVSYLIITVDKNNKVVGSDFPGCDFNVYFDSEKKAEKWIKVNK